MANHHFGAGIFKKELWISQKQVFRNVIRVDVEFIVSGSFDWVFADENGKEIRTLRSKAPGSWTGVNLPSLGLFQDYSIGFRNAGTNELKFKQGDIQLRD